MQAPPPSVLAGVVCHGTEPQSSTVLDASSRTGTCKGRIFTALVLGHLLDGCLLGHQCTFSPVGCAWLPVRAPCPPWQAATFPGRSCAHPLPRNTCKMSRQGCSRCKHASIACNREAKVTLP